jgi:type IV pilus assembly protein PilW
MEKVKRNQGFTVIELLMAVAIGGIVLGSVYSTYTSQQRSYQITEDVTAVQQNLRAAMCLMERELRMAGYDPKNSNQFGFQAAGSYGRATNATNVYFTVDRDEEGDVDDNDVEQIAFRLNGTELQKYSTGAVPWQTVAENISGVSFTYLDASRNTTAVLNEIRSVDLSLSAGKGGHSRILESRVCCRNMGL